MPIQKRRFRKKTGRMVVRRKAPINRRAKRFNRVPRIPIPFPTSFSTTLKYADYFVVGQSVGGVAGAYQFRLNCMYDPDYTGIGHQPYWYDQLAYATMYNKCTVFGAHVKITAACDNPCEVLMRPSLSATTPSSMSLEDERPHSISKMASNASKPVTLSKYYAINQLFGVAKRKIADDSSFSHDWNASPSKIAYLNFMIMNPNSAFTVTASCNVEIRYYARFWDRKPVGQS